METSPVISLWKKIIFPAFAVLLGILCSMTFPGAFLDRIVYDYMICVRGERRIPENVVIVTIDEPSFNVLKTKWPWPRSLHAKLVDTLFKEGVKTVAFDIIFSEPSIPIEDKAFADMLHKHGQVVLAESLEIIQKEDYAMLIPVLPLSEFAAYGTYTGIDTLPIDSDGLLRDCFFMYNGRKTFALAATDSYLISQGKDTLSAYAKKYNRSRINFFGPPDTFQRVSYYQALSPSTHLPEHFFKDKFVFVGFAIRSMPDISTGKSDHYPTPFVRSGSGYMSGVEIQANVSTSLLYNDLMHEIPVLYLWIAGGIVWIAFAFFTFKLGVWGINLIFLLILFILICLGGVLFFNYSFYGQFSLVVISFCALYISLLSLKISESFHEKRFIRLLFSRYLSPPRSSGIC